MESSIQFACLRAFIYYIFIILLIYGGYEDSHVTYGNFPYIELLHSVCSTTLERRWQTTPF